MTRGFLKFRNIRNFRSRLGLAPLCDPGSYRVQAGSTAAHNAQSLLWPRPGATLSPGSWRVQRVPERTGEAAPTSTYTGPFREDLGSLIQQLACCRREPLKQRRQNDLQRHSLNRDNTARTPRVCHQPNTQRMQSALEGPENNTPKRRRGRSRGRFTPMPPDPSTGVHR